MAAKTQVLNVREHDRDSAGMTYVYPVVSRRAGGVSVGINLNVNNACNWRCIYCQVPQLTRGGPPPVDLDLLRRELEAFLADVLRGAFMATRVPEGARRLNDIALSGNGEPTSAREFGAVVDLIARVRASQEVPLQVKTVLITNGSLVHRPPVIAAIERLSRINGEVWFKLDRATDAGIQRINSTRTGIARARWNVTLSAAACPTWIQTCLFMVDAKPPAEPELQAYLDFLRARLDEGVALKGVLLYGLARQSFQPEASRLAPLPAAWLEAFAERIRALGLPVKVTP